MQRFGTALVCCIFCCLLILPRFIFASVVINEILFDPAVSNDTGLEKIEIYNPDAAAADVGGWELYPDGIGYFSFPSGFSLAAQSFVTIHLRASGTNDAGNLYHSAATDNMGDSSGSVVLFRPGGRSKDTIADFVRYQKSGKGEHKTWESDAAKAGLWTVGSFVDISVFTVGTSIGLAVDGVRGSAASWQIYVSPSIGSANAAVGSPPAPPPTASTGAAPPPAAAAENIPPPVPAPPPAPSLGADAGSDAVAIAGAIVQFEGVAFGLDGKPLDGVRYFWNFDDGSTEERKSPTHIFHFSGTYYVNLSVQSGHYAGSDWRTVTVLPAELSLSEIQPGENGFIEIANASASRVDIGGMFLTDDQRFVFRIPAGTVIGPKGVVVLPSVNTHLVPTTYLDLRDARGVTLDVVRFSGSLPVGASWERAGYDFRLQPKPTPGKLAVQETVRQTVAAPRTSPAPAPHRSPPASPEPRLSDLPDRQAGGQVQRGEPPSAEPYAVPAIGSAPAIPSAPPAPAAARPPVGQAAAATVGAAGVMSYAFLGASVILGLMTAAGIIALKRKLP